MHFRFVRAKTTAGKRAKSISSMRYGDDVSKRVYDAVCDVTSTLFKMSVGVFYMAASLKVFDFFLNHRNR